MSATVVASGECPPPESGWAGALLAAWVAGSATLMAWGYGLSAVHMLASRPGWWFGALLAVLVAVAAGRAVGSEIKTTTAPVRERGERWPIALFVLYAGVAAVVVAGSITAFASAPSNWD